MPNIDTRKAINLPIIVMDDDQVTITFKHFTDSAHTNPAPFTSESFEVSYYNSYAQELADPAPVNLPITSNEFSLTLPSIITSRPNTDYAYRIREVNSDISWYVGDIHVTDEGLLSMDTNEQSVVIQDGAVEVFVQINVGGGAGLPSGGTEGQVLTIIDAQGTKGWTTPAGGGDMTKAVYDGNDDGRVDEADQIADGTNTVTAAQAQGHMDDSTIHHTQAEIEVIGDAKYLQISNDLSELNAAGARTNLGLTDADIKTRYESNANTNAYTDSEKSKLASIDAAHYGAPLQTLVELSALAEASITDKERRYVEDELSDYFYDATAVSGDVAPNDQTGGTGFWKKVAVDGETAASIKTKYESNADTNAYTDAEKAKVANVPSDTNTELGNKADKTTTITGQNSISGGGDLSANRTIQLSGDQASPGNSKYYGTDGGGTKGFHDLPAEGGGTGITTVADNTALKALNPSHLDVNIRRQHTSGVNSRNPKKDQIFIYDENTAENDYNWVNTGNRPVSEGIRVRPASAPNDVLKKLSVLNLDGTITVDDSSSITTAFNVFQCTQYTFNHIEGNASYAWAFFDAGDLQVDVLEQHQHAGTNDAAHTVKRQLKRVQISNITGDHTNYFDGAGTIQITNETGTIPTLGGAFSSGEKVLGTGTAFLTYQVGDFMRTAGKQEREILHIESDTELYVRGDPYTGNDVGFQANIGVSLLDYQIRTAAGSGILRAGTRFVMLDAHADYGSALGTDPNNSDGYFVRYVVTEARWTGTTTQVDAELDEWKQKDSAYASAALTGVKIGLELETVKVRGTWPYNKPHEDIWDGEESKNLFHDAQITDITTNVITATGVHNPFPMPVEINMYASPRGRHVAILESDRVSPALYGSRGVPEMWSNDGGVTQINQASYDALTQADKNEYTPLYDDTSTLESIVFGGRKCYIDHTVMIRPATGSNIKRVKVKSNSVFEGDHIHKIVRYPDFTQTEPLQENKALFGLWGAENVLFKNVLWDFNGGMQYYKAVSNDNGWGRNRNIRYEGIGAINSFNSQLRVTKGDSWCLTFGGQIEKLRIDGAVVRDGMQLTASWGKQAKDVRIQNFEVYDTTENAISMTSGANYYEYEDVEIFNGYVKGGGAAVNLGVDKSTVTESWAKKIKVHDIVCDGVGRGVLLEAARWLNDDIEISGITYYGDPDTDWAQSSRVAVHAKNTLQTNPDWNGRTPFTNLKIHNITSYYNEFGIRVELGKGVTLSDLTTQNSELHLFLDECEDVNLNGYKLGNDEFQADGVTSMYSSDFGIVIRDSSKIRMSDVYTNIKNRLKRDALEMVATTDVKIHDSGFNAGEESVVEFNECDEVEVYNTTFKNPTANGNGIIKIEQSTEKNIGLHNVQAYDETGKSNTDPVKFVGTATLGTNVLYSGIKSRYEASNAFVYDLEEDKRFERAELSFSALTLGATTTITVTSGVLRFLRTLNIDAATDPTLAISGSPTHGILMISNTSGAQRTVSFPTGDKGKDAETGSFTMEAGEKYEVNYLNDGVDEIWLYQKLSTAFA